MFNLMICGEEYTFNFGMGFVREIDKTIQTDVPDMKIKQNAGLAVSVARVIDGDLETLEEVLLLANKGFSPRLTRDILDAHIEDESTDIENLFDEVIGFFKTANATKKKTLTLLKITEEEKQ